MTRNLYTALQRLRKPSASRLYWVDAVCIDQVNIAERSHQVALMRAIYHRAAHVIAWIGSDDQYTQKAFGLIEAIVAKTLSINGSFKADAGTIWNHRAMERMGLPRFPSSEWEALAKLFEKPYFRRLWVVQELVVSSEATAWCGPLSIRWAHIEYVAKLILSSGWLRALQEVYGVKVRPSFVQTIGNCKIHFHETQGGPGMALANLLISTRRFQTTDSRDKIIALIGLTKDARKYEATMTDYSKPTADLYKDTTGQLITADQSLLLLSGVEDISYRQIQELPSWVPDYSVWQRSSILGFPFRHSKYSAGGGSPVSVRWTPGSPSLMVDGIWHDEVQAVSPNSLENSPIAQTFLLQCLELAGPLLRQGSISIDSVWRTLIGNTGGDTYPAPEKYRLHFRSYLSRLGARNQAYLKTLARDEDVHALLAVETRELKSGNSQYYQASIAYTAPYRKFFTTMRGTIGLGPRSIRSEDSICVFGGGRVPFILRKDGSRHRLVGEAYVHGIMDGQAIWKNTTFEEFHIW